MALPSAWRSLASTPRVWQTPAPILSASSCRLLRGLLRPYIEASESAPAYEGCVDYRSLPLAACGPAATEALLASGAMDAATEVSGLAYSVGEDVMIARTTACSGAGPEALGWRGLTNLHHDRHKSETRACTVMFYLSSVGEGHGGETFFPCLETEPREGGEEGGRAFGPSTPYDSNGRAPEATLAATPEATPDATPGEPSSDNPSSGEPSSEPGNALGNALDLKYGEGARHLPRESPLITDCDARLDAWRLGCTRSGGGVRAKAGTALVFDADPISGAWHGPCGVSGKGEEKWTVTFFKSAPPPWSPMMMGL